MSKHIDPWEFEMEVNGTPINFGFDGISTVVLFGGSFTINHKRKMTFAEVKADIAENYNEYETEDRLFFYKANGFYD